MGLLLSAALTVLAPNVSMIPANMAPTVFFIENIFSPMFINQN
jgi:hypothetical protein